MVVTKEDVNEIVKMLLINNQKTLQGYVIASLYAKIGDYRTALRYVSNYLQIKPYSFVAYKLQAECYEKLNRPDNALKSYHQAIHSVERKRNLKQVDLDRSFEKIKETVSSEKTKVLKSPTTVDTSAEESTATNNQMDMNEFSSPCRGASAPDMTAGDETETTFQFTIDHISTLDCIVSSKNVVFQNLSWRIIVMPKRDLGVNRTFSFYLLCNGGTESLVWSCNVDVEFRLLSVKQDQYPFVRKCRHLFSNDESDAWGFSRFTSWNDVLNPENNYVQNDCITVEVHVMALV